MPCCVAQCCMLLLVSMTVLLHCHHHHSATALAIGNPEGLRRDPAVQANHLMACKRDCQTTNNDCGEECRTHFMKAHCNSSCKTELKFCIYFCQIFYDSTPYETDDGENSLVDAFGFP